MRCIRARTSAKIRQHADQEHKQQDPKTRRQKNLVVLAECFVDVDSRAHIQYMSVFVSLYCKRVRWQERPIIVVYTVYRYDECSGSRKCGDAYCLSESFIC